MSGRASIASLAVERWQFTLVVFLALVALGVQSLVVIPKAEDPTFPLATFALVAVWPGASPRDVERLVVDPLETRLRTLEGVKTMRTEIEDGLAVLQLEFVAGVDPDRKRDETLREVNALRPSLPPELRRLDLRQFNAAKVNVLEVALVADEVPYRQLDALARALKRRLGTVAAVDDVAIAGLPRPEIEVALDLDRLLALGVAPTEVIGAIGADAVALPAGAVDAGGRRFNVKTSGDYGSVEEVRGTLVRSGDGGTLRVGDLARVAARDAEATQIARFDGRRAVLVAVNLREGQNLFSARHELETELAAFAPSLPPGVELRRGFDQSTTVAHRLGGFGRDLGLAIALVLLTLLPLGVRAAVVVMVSIPLSLAMGLFLLRVTGFSINQLSIVGLVIALGLLVDDSVVVVENIERFLRAGRTPRQAAVEATEQIATSVLGCTATLILAFVPLLALPGTSGSFIRSLPVAVVFTVAASLVVSLTIVPFLASRLLREEPPGGNRALQLLVRVVESTYRPVLRLALGRPWASLAVAAALLAASLALVPRIGFSLFPKAGTPQFLVTIEADEGSSLATTDRAARFVEATLAAHPEVAFVATSVGQGHPQIYYNVSPRSERASVAEVFAELRLEGARADALRERLRAELGGYPGARLTLREFENGPPLEAPVAIRLLGDDEEALRTGAARVLAVLEATPGTRDAVNPAAEQRTDVRVVIDRERAAALAVATPDIDRAVRLAIGGVTAGLYRAAGSDEAWDIRVGLPRAPGTTPADAHRASLAALDRLHVPGARGAPVAFAQLARVAFEPSPARIRHHNRERSVTVTADVRPGFTTDRVTTDALARLAATELPAGVRAAVAGERENRQESFGGLGTAILVACFGVLAVLVLEFRTFRGTLIVASVIPLGVIGGLVALWVSGTTLSFTASIGFVALMGIEVKNSILLVDFTNQLRAEGVPLDEAIGRAGEVRFVPILLTTLTAIGGLIPLVLERSPLYSPLALVILGGLVSSTLLARVVTPVLYRLLPPDLEPAGGSPVEAPRAGEPVAQ